MNKIKLKVYDHKYKMMFDVVSLTQLNNSTGFVKGEKSDSGGEKYITSGYLDKKTLINGRLIERFVLLRYTGFKDVNGKEIYEGYIVKCFNYGDKDHVSEIKFEDGAFMVDVTQRDYDYSVLGWALYRDIAGIEAIGNIYENSELLEVE